MKKLAFGILLAVSACATELPQEVQHSRHASNAERTDESVPRKLTATYIPVSYDISEDLQAESRICFRTNMWFLQPLQVIAPLASSIMVGIGEYLINSNPREASICNAIGLGFGIVDFVASVLSVKINNKLQRIDNYIIEKKSLGE